MTKTPPFHRIGVSASLRLALIFGLVASLIAIAPPDPARAVPGVSVTGSPLAMTEGGTDSYDVVLLELPTDTVTISVSPDAQVTVDKPSLTFTTGDWDVPQTVTVTAVDDAVAEGAHTGTITHAASGGGYDGVGVASVTANITDNDSIGVTVSVSSVAVAEGGATGSYTVRLNSQPSSTVTVSISPNAQVTTSVPSLSFTTANWSSAQTVTVTAVDDAVAEGAHTGTITHAASGGGYDGVGVASVTANITDNDSIGVTVSVSSVAVAEGGATGSYTVRLNSQPSSTVTVSISPNAQVTTSVPSLSFTTANWSSAQTVTVTAVDDAVAEGAHTGTITHAASGGGYDGVGVASVTANITDNDSIGVTVSVSSVAVAEGGATGSYTVRLNSQPSSTVTVSISPNAQVTTSVPSLSFTTANWSSAQTVTVTAVNDTAIEATPHAGTITHAASGGGYDGAVVASVTANITDDDFSVTFQSPTSSPDEGQVGSTVVNVPVVLTIGAGRTLASPATVQAALTATSATLGIDFQFTSPFLVSFPTGSASGAIVNVPVTILADTTDEPNETITLTLQPASLSAGGAIGANPSHTMNIVDDDGPAGLSVLDAQPAAEGSAGVAFTVVLSPASGQTATVTYTAVGGTAVAGADFTPTTGRADLPRREGLRSRSSVPIVDDAVDEITETLTLELSPNTLAAIVDATATGSILDNDNVVPTVSVATSKTGGVPSFEFTTNESVTAKVTFTDPGVADIHNVVLSWGDGTQTSFAVSPVGTRTFERTHAYGQEGLYLVSANVADEAGTGLGTAAVSIQGMGPVGGGGDTVGLVDPTQGLWHLYNSAGALAAQFYFGNPGDYPIYGDWNCDGIETPGMYRQSDGYVYLRDTNTQGPGDIRFFFGNPGDVPIAGDFDGDGCDTVSIYRPSNQTFYIINKLGANDGGLGAADFSYVFGNPGDKPFVGDFDGNGTETVGLHRESTGLVYFRNSHTQGNADNQFIYGDPDDRLVAGDWTGDSIFSPALFRPSTTTMYFRYTNTAGVADAQWVGGLSNWLPISGQMGLG